MYLNFFGLTKDPFKITPDPEFFFSGGNRGAVLEALCYAIAKGEGIVKVVGEVGSGKTMLCRMLERELPVSCEIIYLANPRLDADEILQAIAHELQLPISTGGSKLELLDSLQTYLLDKHANNKRVVMFIEEAQGMSVDTLEEIRMLSNLETTQEKLLQIVLFGQPELDEKLARHEIRQLKERVTYTFELAPLKKQEIRDYVYTRLRASNFRGNELFTAGAIRLLAKYSCGLLRRVNVLADKALLAAFSRGDQKVTQRHVRMAVEDSAFEQKISFLPRFGSAIAATTILAVAIWWVADNGQLAAMFTAKVGGLLSESVVLAEPRSQSTNVATTPARRIATAIRGPEHEINESQLDAQEYKRQSKKFGADRPIFLEDEGILGEKAIEPVDLDGITELISFEALEVDLEPVQGLGTYIDG